MTKKSKQLVKDGEAEKETRGTWQGKLDFLMSALSFAVGMGNLWRFPYLCYQNGGGAFLIPYVIMVILAGVPLIFMEFSLGQYGSLGPVSIWKAVPLFQGIGWTMFAISFISCIYYNMLIAYSFFYTFASFRSDVPWRDCNNWWNTDACRSVENIQERQNCTSFNGTWSNGTCYTVAGVGADVYEQVKEYVNLTASSLPKPKPATDEYFHKYMLDISDSIEDIGGIRWQLALCLLLCWVVVAAGLITGVKSLGKATYVTSILPYLILIILFVRALTLEGSANGIIYYLTPQWGRLLSAKVWGDAAVQVFFSMSICWGGLITLASYNKFDNNTLRDTIVIAIGDSLTSIFGGVVIFSIIGYMAHTLNVPIDDVATQGAGLAFIVYPQAVTRLPISPLWSILFMLMLVNLGIGTQLTLVTTAHTTLLDVFSKYLRKGKRPIILLVALCSFCYLVGLSLTTRGGIYILQVMDSYAPSYGLLIIGFFEMIAIGWVYGLDRFFKDIEQMTGRKPSKFWLVTWKFITPALILAILLFTFIDFKRSTYGDYLFPEWADILGWCICVLEVMCIPGVAIYKVVTCKQGGSIIQRVRFLAQPAAEWGPADEVQRKKEEEENRIPLAIDIQNGGIPGANGDVMRTEMALLQDDNTPNGVASV